ncbi:radical SAM protein [Terasakiella sp. SH-1]|uniref:B12-binding domain-containing radical SAM protein n=1 Tax=Terasakiella sp. SH-1 TaxID=2560057 RepID=UPI0010744141|nr:radical SAM protein [Terasakiella sp. SH-1]
MDLRHSYKDENILPDRKLDVLFIAAPSFYRDASIQHYIKEKESNITSRSGALLMGDQDHEPSHGIFCLKSSCDQAGLSTFAIDMNLLYFLKTINEDFSPNQFLENCIKAGQPDFIALTSMRSNYQEAVKIFSLIKELNHEIPVIFGGSAAVDTTLPFSEKFDYIIRDQLHMTVVAKIFSIVNSSNGKNNILSELTKDTFPTYINIPKEIDLIPRLFQATGCPTGCDFCFPAASKNFKVFMHKNETIETNINKLHKEYDFSYFLIGDLTYFINSKPSKLLNEYIAANNFKPWWCQTQAKMLNETSIKRLKSANCRQIAFAVEDLETSNSSIRLKNKSFRETERILTDLRSAQIDSQMYWIFGLPDDTHASCMKKIEDISYFVSSGLVSSMHLSYLMPYPGTSYGDQPEQYGIRMINTLDHHFAGVKTDFYDVLPIYETKHLKCHEIFHYFNEARRICSRKLSEPA